ncbi:MAG: Hsp70 family protein, partial [Planctomycetes bacterium]|nr:Hsp70 family protein [Planctomycetota bacterium]
MGIDLGTTNCAVGYVDTQESAWKVRTFQVPQLIAPGQVELRDTLPSFHYQPAAGEFSADSLRLPWQPQTATAGAANQDPTPIVGSLARDHGILSQGRLIESAKSWLCHAGVDRTAELLPWHGLPEVTRISPVEASARYLKHIHEAWNFRFPEAPLASQDVIITLPASFDEVARELTLKASALAGLPRVVLIEEPQAAFYAWINRHRDSWEQQVKPGQKILVCDIGGGTSDFTLIRVRGRDDGKVQFQRVAVGEHLILGGDNLDLALAHALEAKLSGERKLEPRQWGVLVRLCRQVKETLLGEKPPEQMTVHLPSSGSRLIGGGLQVEVTRTEVERLLVEGFLPQARLDERPSRHRSGFQEFGLPYATDPAITRYLADFLATHRHVGEEIPTASQPVGDKTDAGEVGKSRKKKSAPAPGTSADHDHARPDIILFNGGFFASPVLRQRFLDVLTSWFPSQTKTAWSPLVLDHDRLDLAVAHGAAYYGMVRRGVGVKIAAGLARTYYIGVEGAEPRAVCLIAAGTEPGHSVELEDPTFDLLVSQPVEFPLYVSSTRLTDQPGTIVPFDREQMTPLPSIRTVLRSSAKGETGRLPIQLHARLTEIGTLDLWCASLDHNRRWKLQFDVRSTTQSDVAPHQGAAEREGFVDEAAWERCAELIRRTFGPQGTDDPEGLIKRLAEAIGTDRREWPASLLRRLWEALFEVESGRTRTATHEARWLNLAGFALRPGYGLAADDWRVGETRRILLGKSGHATATCLSERL